MWPCSFKVFLLLVLLCNLRFALLLMMASLEDFETLLDSKLEPIRERLDNLFKKMNDNQKALQDKIKNQDLKIESLKVENTHLANKLQMYEDKYEEGLNNLEQYSRRECVEISGIPERQDEDTNDLVMKVGSLIGLDISESDISVSHRLPRRTYSAAVSDGPQASSNVPYRAPNIIAKFIRRNIRDRFYKARKHLRNKSTKDLDSSRYSGDRIYISENLTQKNKEVFKESLRVKKDLKFQYIWTSYGRIYLRKDSASPVITILKKSDLDFLRNDGRVQTASSGANR